MCHANVCAEPRPYVHMVWQSCPGELGVAFSLGARVPLYQSKSGTLAVGAPVAILSYGDVHQSIDECPRHMGVQVGLVDTRDAAGHKKRIPKLQVYSFHSCVCA